MRLALVLTAVSILLVPVNAQQQAAPAGAFEFDVASVRPVKLATEGRPQDLLPSPLRVLPGDRFQTEHAWLRSLVAFAYGFERTIDRIRGGGPILDDTFEVVAKGAPGSFSGVSNDQLQPVRHMAQRLLADRFNLQVHSEQEQRRVLLLKRASPTTMGNKLRPLPDGCRTVTPFSEETAADAQRPRCKWLPDGGTLTATGTFREFATNFGASMNREVIDETGLSGSYLFAITFDPDTVPRQLPPEISRRMLTGRFPELPEFKTVLKSDLGVVLEEATRPVPVLVITHIEPLKEN